MSIIISLAVLVAAAVQDAREKQIYVIFPLLLIAVNVGLRLFMGDWTVGVVDVIFAVALLSVSVLGGQKLGLGDVLILVGLLPLCGISGCIRILVDGFAVLFIWEFVKRAIKKADQRDNERAFVPFLAAGYVIWMVV